MFKNLIKKTINEVATENNLKSVTDTAYGNKYAMERINDLEGQIRLLCKHLKISIVPTYEKHEIREHSKASSGGVFTANSGAGLSAAA